MIAAPGMSTPEDIEWFDFQHLAYSRIAGNTRDYQNHQESQAGVGVRDAGGVFRQSQLRGSNQKGEETNPEAISSQGGERGLEQYHVYKFTTFRADCLECAEVLKVFEDEGVEGLPGNGSPTMNAITVMSSVLVPIPVCYLR